MVMPFLSSSFVVVVIVIAPSTTPLLLLLFSLLVVVVEANGGYAVVVAHDARGIVLMIVIMDFDGNFLFLLDEYQMRYFLENEIIVV